MSKHTGHSATKDAEFYAGVVKDFSYSFISLVVILNFIALEKIIWQARRYFGSFIRTWKKSNSQQLGKNRKHYPK